MKKPLVYIILLNWNGIEHLPTCLRSLHRLAYGNLKVIMVDNGSTDGSQKYVIENFPEVEILQQRKNIGFAAANNIGMLHALARNADYIALLNNDMEVDRDWIYRLVETAESDARIGACATKMLYFYNRDIIQGVGVYINRIGIAWDHLNGRYDCARPQIDKEVLGVCGGAFFVRAGALRKAGLFDPKYFIYLEDVELSMRIWDAGYRIVTVPGARVYHKFAATMVEQSYRKNYLMGRNRLRFIFNCFPSKMIPSSMKELLAWEFKAARDNYWKGDFSMILNQLHSFIGFLIQLPSTFVSRLSRGPVRSPEVWRLVKSNPVPPRIRLPQKPPEKWESATENSVRLGCPPPQLGPGWYRMFDKSDLSYRWFSKEASVSLKRPREGQLTLTLTIGNDYRQLEEISLTIEVDGEEIGTVIPDAGWHVYRLNLPPSAKKTAIVRLRSHGLYSADDTHELTDLSFKVKEIGLRT